MQFRFHVGEVGHPFPSDSTVVESIGIRIDIDAFKLPADHSFKHFFQFRIFICQLYVRPDLCSGITQPHGMNIACVNKSVGLAICCAVMNGCFQGIGETIFEHPCQFLIGKQLFYPDDFCFHSF